MQSVFYFKNPYWHAIQIRLGYQFYKAPAYVHTSSLEPKLLEFLWQHNNSTAA